MRAVAIQHRDEAPTVLELPEDVQADDVVLVSGATGGVGAFAVKLAVARGARVIATARPGEPGDFAQRLGAAEVVDFTDDLEAAVRAIAPDGVTKIVHTAGDAGALSGLSRSRRSDAAWSAAGRAPRYGAHRCG